jgi:hypothetical protein
MNIKRVIAASAATAIVLLLGATPALADLTSIHVYAYGVFVDYTDGSGHVGLGPVPVFGPFNTDTNFLATPWVSINSPKVTGSSSIGVEAHAVGAGGMVYSQSSYLDLSALAGTVTADEGTSQCSIHYNTPDYLAMGTTVTNGLIVNGVAVPDGVQPPNTVIPVVSDAFTGTVTVNEQTYDPLTNTLSVTAIHIHATAGTEGTGDIFIGHVECGGLVEPPVDIPESPFAILIPLVGLAAIAGAWYLRRNPITGASH